MIIRIEPQVHADIMTIVKGTKTECSGMARIVPTKHGYDVVSTHFIKQENGMATTDIDPTDLGRVMFETKDMPGMLNCWWHSHADMQAFWSGTDRKTIEELGEHGFVVAIVFNHKGEYRAAFFRKGDDRTPDIFMDNLQVIADNSQEREQKLLSEFVKYNLPKTYPIYKQTHVPQSRSYSYEASGPTFIQDEDLAYNYNPMHDYPMFDTLTSEQLNMVENTYHRLNHTWPSGMGETEEYFWDNYEYFMELFTEQKAV